MQSKGKGILLQLGSIWYFLWNCYKTSLSLRSVDDFFLKTKEQKSVLFCVIFIEISHYHQYVEARQNKQQATHHVPNFKQVNFFGK